MTTYIFQAIGIAIFLTISFGIGYYYGIKDCRKQMSEMFKKYSKL